MNGALRRSVCVFGKAQKPDGLCLIMNLPKGFRGEKRE